MNKTPRTLASIDLDLLDHVSGGMNMDGFRLSDNVEDRRPQWAGGPVSNDAWQQEQNGYNNSCWWSADGNQYSGDSNGGPAQQMPDFNDTDLNLGDGSGWGSGDGGGGDGGF